MLPDKPFEDYTLNEILSYIDGTSSLNKLAKKFSCSLRKVSTRLGACNLSLQDLIDYKNSRSSLFSFINNNLNKTLQELAMESKPLEFRTVSEIIDRIKHRNLTNGPKMGESLYGCAESFGVSEYKFSRQLQHSNLSFKILLDYALGKKDDSSFDYVNNNLNKTLSELESNPEVDKILHQIKKIDNLSTQKTELMEIEVKEEDIIDEQEKVYPILTFDREKVLEVISTLYELGGKNSKRAENCTRFSEYLIDYFLTGALPKKESTFLEKSDGDHFGHYPIYEHVEVKLEDDSKIMVDMISGSILDRETLLGSKVPYESFPFEDPKTKIIDVDSNFIDLLSHTHLQAHLTELNDKLMKEATASSYNISFGYIILTCCGKYLHNINEVDHMLVYYATPSKVNYIDSKKFPDKEACIFSSLENNYRFLNKKIKKISRNTYGTNIFFASMSKNILIKEHHKRSLKNNTEEKDPSLNFSHHLSEKENPTNTLIEENKENQLEHSKGITSDSYNRKSSCSTNTEIYEEKSFFLNTDFNLESSVSDLIKQVKDYFRVKNITEKKQQIKWFYKEDFFDIRNKIFNNFCNNKGIEKEFNWNANSVSRFKPAHLKSKFKNNQKLSSLINKCKEQFKREEITEKEKQIIFFLKESNQENFLELLRITNNNESMICDIFDWDHGNYFCKKNDLKRLEIIKISNFKNPSDLIQHIKEQFKLHDIKKIKKQIEFLYTELNHLREELFMYFKGNEAKIEKEFHWSQGSLSRNKPESLKKNFIYIKKSPEISSLVNKFKIHFQNKTKKDQMKLFLSEEFSIDRKNLLRICKNNTSVLCSLFEWEGYSKVKSIYLTNQKKSNLPNLESTAPELLHESKKSSGTRNPLDSVSELEPAIKKKLKTEQNIISSRKFTLFQKPSEGITDIESFNPNETFFQGFY